MRKAEWAPRLNKLSRGRRGLPVVLNMCLCRFCSVVPCMLMVSISQLRMMRGRLELSCFVVLRGFLVVSRSVFVMFCCLLVMLRCLL
jgi:hypothetical protein